MRGRAVLIAAVAVALAPGAAKADLPDPRDWLRRAQQIVRHWIEPAAPAAGDIVVPPPGVDRGMVLAPPQGGGRMRIIPPPDRGGQRD